MTMKELKFHEITLKFHSKTRRFLGVQILKIIEKKLEIEKPWESETVHTIKNFELLLEFLESRGIRPLCGRA